jgi:ArsR family transcriptional regulator
MYAKTSKFDPTLQELARLGKVFSHPARLAIVQYLARSGECMVGNIADQLPFLSRTTVSQHLQELKKSGLIQGEIEGTKICYCIDRAVLKRAGKLLFEFFRETEENLNNCCE